MSADVLLVPLRSHRGALQLQPRAELAELHDGDQVLVRELGEEQLGADSRHLADTGHCLWSRARHQMIFTTTPQIKPETIIIVTFSSLHVSQLVLQTINRFHNCFHNHSD